MSHKTAACGLCRGEPLVDVRDLAAAVERNIRGVAMGALAVLNAHFYEAMHASFVEVALQDPVGAYREALKVMPETMVRSMFSLILRALGASALEVDEALEELGRGEASKFLEVARRHAEGGHGGASRRGGGYETGGIYWAAWSLHPLSLHQVTRTPCWLPDEDQCHAAS